MTMNYILWLSRMKDVLTIDLDESAKRELADLAQQEGVAIGTVAERALRTGLTALRSALKQSPHARQIQSTGDRKEQP